MKKLLFLLSCFLFTQSFSQERDYDIEIKTPFQPMFSVGSGYYNSLGDIQGPKGNFLLGNMGIRTGVRINLSKHLDMSFLFTSNAKLYERENINNYFESKLNSVGFNFDYTFHNILRNTKISPFTTFGTEWIYFKTISNKIASEQESGITMPIGVGVTLDVSERIRFDVGMNYHLSFVDIDHAYELKNNDHFSVVTFTMHYDLFTPKPKKENNYDDAYYANVNFKRLDVLDSDGDRVPDIDDNCPETPQGTRVDEKGCPIDTDNDGIPDYLDEEKNTLPGAVVDERGIQLTEEQYHSMYSEYEAASREYAKFYNESEIQKENYKTVNEYLIAKANAFNKAYNEGTIKEEEGIRYKVQLGKYSDEIDENIMNQLLSYEDLESIPQEDGSIIYAVGSYKNNYEAQDRQMLIELNDGRAETRIITDEDGVISIYMPESKVNEEEKQIPNKIKDKENKEVVENTSIEKEKDIDNKSKENNLINEKNKNQKNKSIKSKIIYRVQIGAFNEEISTDVFKGIKNLIILKDGGYTKYLVGAYTDHEKALISKSEMIARGFEDAFIVTYKDGKRIGLNTAIKEYQNTKRNIQQKQKSEKLNVKFLVQIGAWKGDIDNKTESLIKNIGEVKKIHVAGDLYQYIAGTYSNLQEAEQRRKDVKNKGFTDSFIFATYNGKRIKIKDAQELLR